MPISPGGIAAILDAGLPASGTIGYIALIDNSTATVTVSSIDTSTDVITTTAAHGLVTGTRVRGSSTGALPGVVASATDYYIRSLSSTTLALFETLGNAQSNTSRLNFADTGSGTITLLEQALKGGLQTDTIMDDLDVWINHELDHTDYARIAVTDLGAVTESTGAKPSYLDALTANSPNGNIVFRHAVYLHGGESTIGSTIGDWYAPSSNATAITITEGSTRTQTFNFKGRSSPTAF